MAPSEKVGLFFYLKYLRIDVNIFQKVADLRAALLWQAGPQNNWSHINPSGK